MAAVAVELILPMPFPKVVPSRFYLLVRCPYGYNKNKDALVGQKQCAPRKHRKKTIRPIKPLTANSQNIKKVQSGITLENESPSNLGLLITQNAPD